MIKVNLLILLLSSFAVIGQTGPAGVGSTASNGIWLRAGDFKSSK